MASFGGGEVEALRGQEGDAVVRGALRVRR